ncbi:MAG: chemotaxis protein CheX [Nitriliruptoraceae bacterium]|nr:chemotaxis protein CheX [Nitriliruptoraceae bacterium]
MEPTALDLERIGADIWAAMLGIELVAKHDGASHDPDDRVVTGLVQITGAWEGAVSVQLTERLAITAAASMFALEPDEVTEEEVTDTVGELANMTGGNVKSMLEGELQLSLPSVTSGRQYTLSLPGAHQTARVAMETDGEVVLLTILKRDTV